MPLAFINKRDPRIPQGPDNRMMVLEAHVGFAKLETTDCRNPYAARLRELGRAPAKKRTRGAALIGSDPVHDGGIACDIFFINCLVLHF